MEHMGNALLTHLTRVDARQRAATHEYANSFPVCMFAYLRRRASIDRLISTDFDVV
jgi:hypothetical protein